MRDVIKCAHDDEFPRMSKPCAADDNQVPPSHPSPWRSRIRATTDSFAYPLPPSNASTEVPRKRRHYIYPREDSGVYMPSGLLDHASDRPTSHYRLQVLSNPSSGHNPSQYRPEASSTPSSDRAPSHCHPEAPSNPFEDPQYEIGAAVSERRPMREWQDVLEDQRSDPSGSAAKRKYGKAYRGRLRSRIQTVFKSAKKADCKHQQQAASTLLDGEGTHLRRGTMGGLQCMNCQREMEARSLVR